MGVRKNQARMTAQERARFVDAVLQLKASGMWDHHIHRHRTAMLSRNPDPAHLGPAFPPWHRECLRRLELELEAIDPRISIPYWDWTRTRSTTATLWRQNFMGGNGRRSDQRVMSGSFAYSTGQWRLTVNDTANTPPYLRRAFGIAARTLPTAQQVNAALATARYDSSPWNANSRPRFSFRNGLERIHNQVHLWVGGTMLGATSPNDPIFWLHHCNVDRLWARWQRIYGTNRYSPLTGGPRGHNRNDAMWPWDREADPPTPAKVLNHAALGYTYDDEANW